MTIKEELKKQLQQEKAKQTEEIRDLEKEAKVMIEEFLIPKFRECAKAEIAKKYDIDADIFDDGGNGQILRFSLELE